MRPSSSSLEPSPAEVHELAERIEARFPPLSADERRIALAVFRELSLGRPAGASAIAGRAGVARELVEGALGRWPSVHRDSSGGVIGFWGLALEGAHPVRSGEGRLYAWCAWDTLFLGELLGEELTVESTCALTGRAVRVRAGADGLKELDPEEAVISFVDPGCCDAQRDRVRSSFCRHILFFESEDAWSRWAAEYPLETFAMAVEEGWRLGKVANHLRYGTTLDEGI